MLDYTTMSPPHGECIVVNPAVASAVDKVLSPELFETPRRCLENSNALLIGASRSIVVIAEQGDAVIMNGSIGKGPGGTGKGHHHHYQYSHEKKCGGKWSKPNKCRGAGDDEAVEEILAETLANMRLKEKNTDEKKKSQTSMLPAGETTACKISRSPPSKVEETKTVSEKKVSSEDEQKSKDNCKSTSKDEDRISAAENSCTAIEAKPDREEDNTSPKAETDETESVKPVAALKTFVSKSEEKLSPDGKSVDNNSTNVDKQRKCSSDEDSKKKHASTTGFSPASASSLTSPTSTTSAGGKRLFVKPKDIINSTRQKSLILAHKSKTASAPPIPQHVVTRDLLGADLRKCRDSKNVDELAKALSEQLNVVAASPSPSSPSSHQDSSTILIEGQRIQRSPIPVPSTGHNRRAAVAPYNVQMAPNHRGPEQHCSNFSSPYGSCSQQSLNVCNENPATSGYYDQQQQAHSQQQKPYQNYPYNSISNNSSYVQVCTVYSASPQYEDICSPPYWSPGSGDESPYSCLPSVEQPTAGAYENPNSVDFRPTNFHPPCVYSSCTVSKEPSDWSRRSSDVAGELLALQDDSSGLPSDFNGNEVCPSSSNAFERPIPVRDAIPTPTGEATSPEIRKADRAAVSDELPEPLTDFILDYSWKEGTTNCSVKADDTVNTGQCFSPYSASSASAASPAAPKQAQVPPQSPEKSKSLTCSGTKPATNTTVTQQGNQETKLPTTASSSTVAAQTPESATRRKSAKQQLREMIKNDEFNKAWIWALRCSQASPGALFYRDADGDSFLHIVVWQKDMAKIYSLTELMKSNDAHQVKPFDLRNKLNETPLFLAVEKRLKEVVAYGLENCSNPNIQAFNRDQDNPLHYAAARGMTDIVQILCECPLIDINVLNGSGLTPLMSGVKSHRNTDEENQSLIDNKSVVGSLLKCGADAKICDSKTGKTLFHYAIECMDPQMMRMFREHLDKEQLHTLANQRCYAGHTPLELLSMTEVTRGFDYVSTEEGQLIRIEMGRLLAEFGAELPRMTAGSGTESPDFYYSYDASFFP